MEDVLRVLVILVLAAWAAWGVLVGLRADGGQVAEMTSPPTTTFGAADDDGDE